MTKKEWRDVISIREEIQDKMSFLSYGRSTGSIMVHLNMTVISLDTGEGSGKKAILHLCNWALLSSSIL